MGKRRSRTYRLLLSGEGLNLFLRCHLRLARMTSSLISYGTTLFVALLLVDDLDDRGILAALGGSTMARLAGSNEHFVGASNILAETSFSISTRLQSSGLMSDRPKIAHLYLVGIATMIESEDDAVSMAYRKMSSLLRQRP